MENTGCLKQNVGSVDRIIRLAVAVVLWIWPLVTASAFIGAEILSALGGPLSNRDFSILSPIPCVGMVNTQRKNPGINSGSDLIRRTAHQNRYGDPQLYYL
jgi:hypothetical protein